MAGGWSRASEGGAGREAGEGILAPSLQIMERCQHSWAPTCAQVGREAQKK